MASHRPLPLRRRAILAAATLPLALAVSSPAEAGPATETLRGVYHEANRILAEPTGDHLTTRLAAIARLFNSVFDVHRAAQYSLGREWHARTAAEQDDFTRLFADLLQRSYVSWLASRADVDATAGLSVHYLGERVKRDTASVRVVVVSRGGGQIFLTHDMVYRTRRWMVRDILIEGVSLVENYRAQFERIIRGSSYRDLVARMRARTTEGAASGPVLTVTGGTPDPVAPHSILTGRGQAP